MAGVIVRQNESFDEAFRRFKRLCEREGILSEIKLHQEYEKPSERKKRRLDQAKRRHLRRQRLRIE